VVRRAATDDGIGRAVEQTDAVGAVAEHGRTVGTEADQVALDHVA
jgi:hypothetical protein